MFFRSVIWALVAMIFLIRPAFAYLDASITGMVIQGAVAIVAGGLVCVKLYWTKLKDLFHSAPSASEGETTEAGESFQKADTD